MSANPLLSPHTASRAVWVKICGVREIATLRQVIDAGADAVGLNFYTPSPRSVTVDVARTLSQEGAGEIERVGLFVNHPVEFVLATARDCQLDTVQLHGDESTAEITAVAREFPVIRAFRVGPAGLGPVADELAQLRALGVRLRGALVDAQVAGAYGGTWPGGSSRARLAKIRPGCESSWFALKGRAGRTWPPDAAGRVRVIVRSTVCGRPSCVDQVLKSSVPRPDGRAGRR
jgi:phosphoribosylanthranilate isomerase